MINKYLIGPLQNVAWAADSIKYLAPITIDINTFGTEMGECIKKICGPNAEYIVLQYKGGEEDGLSTAQKGMAILSGLSQKLGKNYVIKPKRVSADSLDGYDGGGTQKFPANTGKWEIQIRNSSNNAGTTEGILIGCSSNPELVPFLDMNTVTETSGGYNWYLFKGDFVVFESNEPGRKPKLTDIVKECVETQLAIDNQVVNFDFTNDWLNGSLYAPRFLSKRKKDKKTGKPKSVFCGSKTSAYLRMKLVQPCAVSINKNGESNGDTIECENGMKCHEKTASIGINKGVINNLNDIHYYRSIETPGNTTGKYLHATEVILLGSLNDCDQDGIPQLHQILPSTSFKLPPESFEPDMEDGFTDITDHSELSLKEISGIDWGSKKDDGSYTIGNGLFIAVGCLESDTLPKTCVNASRLCEVGVDFDEKHVTILDGVETTKFIDGVISLDEITDGDVRGMFATLNSNNLKTKNNKYNQPKYEFKYTFPNGFDGKLIEVNSQDTFSSDYYKFRFGLSDSASTGYSYIPNDQHNTFPRYDNSFYFYFGLKAGSTALDLFNTQYFTPCTTPGKDVDIKYNLTIVNHATTPISNNGRVEITDIINDNSNDSLIIIRKDNIEIMRSIITDNKFTVSNLSSGSYEITISDNSDTSISKTVTFLIHHIYTANFINGSLEYLPPPNEYTVEFINYKDEETATL